MSHYQLPSPEKKPEYVQRNFDQIAKAYDRFNDWNSFFLHRLWKKNLVKKAKEMNPNAEVALDLCCGTGDITVQLTKNGHLKKIQGLDFSEEMLSFAKQKLIHEPRATLQWGDAMDLRSISDGTIDVVTMGFGLRNVGNIETCLKEVYRVLKPSGVFLNLDVGKVDGLVLRKLADFYFFKVVPILGYLVYGGKNTMFDYLPHSSLTYPDQRTLVQVLGNVGFREIGYKNFVFGNAVLHYCRK